MKSPFKFLDAYELKDRAVFFGREEEIETLYSMVFQTPLLLMFGSSGTGKTSLIRCGLASRFTGPNWYPFFIRRGDDLNQSIRQALGNALPDDEPLQDSLKANVSLLFRHFLRPVYLIFDQFEELFIMGSRAEQEEFSQSIRELIDAELPCKVLLVMREEFIGQLYYIEKTIPSIYDFRLRVEPMGMKKVLEVIQGSLGHFKIELSDPEANIERMYNNISVGKSGIQLPYLQVYLDMFWREDFVRTYPATAEQEYWQTQLQSDPPNYPPLVFTDTEIDDFGNIEKVLGDFLRKQEGELQKELQSRFGKAIPSQAVRPILDLFVTDQGTKQPQRYRRVEGHLQLTSIQDEALPYLPPEALPLALEHLYNARLLRERDDGLELAHDSLAALIFRERSDEQRRVGDIINRLNSAYREYELSNGQEYPSRRILSDAEEIMDTVRLTPELLRFIAKSKTEIQSRENAERERAQRELQLTQEKLQLEQRTRSRIQRFTWLLGFVALAAVGASVVAVSSQKMAEQALCDSWQADLSRLESEKKQAEKDAETFKNAGEIYNEQSKLSKIQELEEKIERIYNDLQNKCEK